MPVIVRTPNATRTAERHPRGGTVVQTRAVIRLRARADADLDALFRWTSDPDAVALAAFTSADPADRAAFDTHRARIAADPDVLERMVTRDDELVGMIASFTIEGDRELTYWVDRAQWGNCIAAEAVRLFLPLEQRRPLHARVAAHNVRSARVVERAGFRAVGTEESWADGVQRMVTETVYRLE